MQFNYYNVLGVPPAAPQPITIFNEPTLADKVVSRLQSRQFTLLRMPQHTANGAEKVQVSVITTSGAVLSWLSAYAPGVFELGDASGSVRGCYVDGVDVELTRVGSMTGDVHILFRGDQVLTIKMLGLFLEKTCKSKPLCLSILIDRVTSSILPHRVDGTYFKASRFPYGLLPGTLLTLSSDVSEELLFFAVEISKGATHLKGPRNMTKFNSPRRAKSKPLSEITTYEKEKPKPQKKLTKADTAAMVCKILELTRAEVTYLIGRSGEKITELRAMTRAKITIVPIDKAHVKTSTNSLKPYDGRQPQFVRITGTPDQVQKALKAIEDEVYQYRSGGTIRY